MSSLRSVWMLMSVFAFSASESSAEDYSLVWAEYEDGDYQRRFTLSDEIDRDGIEATIKDGVLRLYLPKADIAKTRKISVKAG